MTPLFLVRNWAKSCPAVKNMNGFNTWLRNLTRFDHALLAIVFILAAIAIWKIESARSCVLIDLDHRHALMPQEQELVDLASDTLRSVSIGTKDSLEWLCKKHPDLAKAQLALARIAARQGDRFCAARAYHAAIVADPNLADDKAPGSIFAELRVFLLIAFPQIDAAHHKHPDDTRIKETWSMANHTKRMLAGGCE